jgi:L-fucose isomerase-like protein
VSFIEGARKRLAGNRNLYAREAKSLRAKIRITGFADNEPLMRILAVRDQMLALAGEHNLDGLAVQDFTSLVDAMGTYCFFATSMVSDVLPVSMESDIHGAISAILLHRAALGAESVFLTEFTIRHPKDDNGVLLWHSGAPVSLCRPGVKMELGRHWILPSPLAGMTHFPLKQGPITVARFDGDHGAYKLAVGEGRSMPGPSTRNNYVWMKVDDWPQWERLLIEGAFIHHTAMAYGHYADVLAEAGRYIPGLKVVMLKKGTKL